MTKCCAFARCLPLLFTPAHQIPEEKSDRDVPKACLCSRSGTCFPSGAAPARQACRRASKAQKQNQTEETCKALLRCVTAPPPYRGSRLPSLREFARERLSAPNHSCLFWALSGQLGPRITTTACSPLIPPAAHLHERTLTRECHILGQAGT